MMANYRLLSHWRIEAPREQVYRAIRDSWRWPQWWPGVESVIDLEPGEPSGLGRVQRYTWKGLLPYRVSFELRVTRIEPGHALEGVASGELEGIGRWRFSSSGPLTDVRYAWQVRTTRPWMNALAPVARPIFEWNHHAVMRRGAVALAGRLGARLVEAKRACPAAAPASDPTPADLEGR